MKQLLTLLVLSSCSVFAQNTVELSVYFDKNSDVPHMPEMAMLNEVTEDHRSEELRFSVVGFTDSSGSEDYNRKLAKRRTRSVVNHLLLSGIKPYNIIFDYEGEVCDASEADEASMAMNRRVDILISNVGRLDDEGFAGLYSESTFNKPVPMKSSNVETFVINADGPNCIETANGTLIDIPPMAFMDAYGRPISGEVEVQYEEYSDPFSIFMSGITMKVDENGVEETLESAGMFSLTATQRNRPVELRPDKEVNMEFVSTSGENNFDFYFLDPTTSTWNNLGVASIRESDSQLIEEVENISYAVVEYLLATDYLSPSKASRVTLEEHFQNLEYMQGRPISSYYRYLRNGDEVENRRFLKIWRREANFRVRVLPKNRKIKEDVAHFKIEKRFSNRLNPEWNRFRGEVWEYDGPLTRKEFRAQINRKRFQNLRVRYDAETETVQLDLKNLDSIARVPVKKVAVMNASLDFRKRMWGEFSPTYEKIRLRTLNRSFELRYKGYSRSLARQERDVQRDADRFDSKSEREHARNLKRAYRKSRRMMTQEERDMTYDEWLAYAADRASKMEMYAVKQRRGNEVVRSLVIDRMGIYNCDRLLKRKDLQTVQPRFVLADGSAIDHKATYVFEKRVNGVIAYGAEAISFNPKKLKMILLVDMEGKTYQLNETEVIAMNKSQSAQRIMHVTEFDHTPESLREVKDVLGLAAN